MDPILIYSAAALSGLVVGLLLTVFGGGWVLATPLLIYFVGVSDPHVAIGVSAAAVAVNALMGLAVQSRAGRVKWPCATVFAVAAPWQARTWPNRSTAVACCFGSPWL